MPGQSVGIPYISQVDLNSAILAHKSLAADFGVYEQQSKAGAVSRDGILKLAPLLQPIVLLQPLCELNHAQMKAAFMELARQDPKVDKGRYATKIWAGLRAERLRIVMNHARRAVRDGGCMQEDTCEGRGQPSSLRQQDPTSNEDFTERLGLGSKTKGAKKSHDTDGLSSADLHLMYYTNSNSFGMRARNGNQLMTGSKKGHGQTVLE